MNSEASSHFNQAEPSIPYSIVSIPDTVEHAVHYQQASAKPTTSGSLVITTSSSIARRPIMSKLLQYTTPVRPQMLVTVKGEGKSENTPANPASVQNQLISLPLRLENLQGTLQLLAASSGVIGAQTALIPVIVSTNELFEVQEGQAVVQRGHAGQSNLQVRTNTSEGQHPSSISKQNSTLTQLLAAPPKVLTNPSVSRNPRTAPNMVFLQQSTSETNMNLNSNNPLLVVNKSSVTKSLGSPVYKSKLEKAMAQTSLLQNSSKKFGNKGSLSGNATHFPVNHEQQLHLAGGGVKSMPNATGHSMSSVGPIQLQYDTDEQSIRAIPQEVLPNYLSSDLHHHAKSAPEAEFYRGMQHERTVAMTKQHYTSGSSPEPSQEESTHQYSLIPDPDYFQANPRIMDVFSISQAPSVSSMDFEVVQNTSSAYSMMQTGNSFPESQQEDMTMEKLYEDNFLAKQILNRLWNLREEGVLCDAALYTDSREFRVHKVVLAGLSPEMAKTIELQPDLQMILPNDILEDIIHLFLFYIYHGVIRLSQGNVLQINRLAELFGASELKKHCLEFCKEARMEQYLDQYKEDSKQPLKVPVSSGSNHQQFVNTAENQCQVPEVDVPPVRNSISDSHVPNAEHKKNIYETLETISSEIDWITNDPSQSNIPIRKRGRNRKSVPSSSVRNKEDTSGQTNISDAARKGQKDVTIAPEIDIVSRAYHPKKNELSKFELSQFDNDYVEMLIGQETSAKHPDAQNCSNNQDVANKENELIEEFVDQLASLPDPLVTGKLDESELLKLKPKQNVIVVGKGKRFRKQKPLPPQPTLKTITTRTRSRATNLSVLEAATAIKAKSNDMSTASTPAVKRGKRGHKKTLDDKKIGGKKLNAEDTVVSESIKATESKRSVEEVVSENFAHNEAVNRNDKQESRGKGTQIEEIAETLEKTHKQQVTGLEKDIVAKYPSAPKKPRFRRTTVDQSELKDTVYMRPPPKKRTKEIREMMQNEEDEKVPENDTEETVKASVDLNVIQKRELQKENTVVKIKSRRKRPKVKNDAIMTQVYEVERNAGQIDSERIYKCSFCAVEFKFAKRAVTHLIGTHATDLEDASQYITVHKKSDNVQELKECDICGFRPKESGTYYIHYHKYFRHQIPLPKGWQAYKCDICEKEFFTKFQLREHKLIHFEDNPFVCETCGSGFRSRTCLNSHVFHKHSTVRKHKCPDCPKTFKTATQCKVHQRTHSGEKPFLCPTGTCVYRSTTRGNMKLHLNSKHRLNPNTVKQLMKELEASEMDPEQEEMMAADLTNAPNKGNDSTVYNVLVENRKEDQTFTAENNCEQYIPSQMENMNQGSGMVPVYTEIADARDYSLQLANQAPVHSQELDMVSQPDNRLLDNPNIPHHVEMLIQDADRFMQQQSQSGQAGFVQDFPQSAHESSSVQDLRSRVPQQSFNQSYPSATVDSARYGGISANQTVHKMLDPHSKEARLMLREAFEGHASRSLLKSAILQGNSNQVARKLELESRYSQSDSSSQSHCSRLSQSCSTSQELGSRQEASSAQQLGTRHVPDTSCSQEAALLKEAEKLVIDLQESGDQQMMTDDVVQRLRNQENLHEMSREMHSISQQPYQSYPNSESSQTVYSSSPSHGLLNIPSSNIATQSGATLTPVTMSDGQGHMHSLSGVQGQIYQVSGTHTTASQYGSDGNVYPGYYQDQYDIENY